MISTSHQIMHVCKFLLRRPSNITWSKMKYKYCTTASSQPNVIAKQDSETERKKQILLMEMESLRQDGFLVPKELNENHWNELLVIKTKNQRNKFFKFIALKELFKVKDKVKRKERKKKRQMELDNSGYVFLYDESGRKMPKNTTLIHIRETTMARWYNFHQANAIMFGPKLILDLGYDSIMTTGEVRNTANQIIDMYSANKYIQEPFHFIFCNAQRSASPGSYTTLQLLEKFIPTLHEPSCLLDVTDKSYLDIFPKDKLVYLTPHCKTEMKTYDPNLIYIIGGIVDKCIQEPVSLARAKKENLAMAKFPLDNFLDWGLGNKALTLDQVMKIMIDIKETGDWEFALRHVPKRKLKDENYYATLAKEEKHSKLKYSSTPRLRHAIKSIYEDKD